MNSILDAITYFRGLFNYVDKNAEEISFVSGVMEEVCFNYKDDLPPALLAHFHVIRQTFFQDIMPMTIEAFSFQRADGRVYKEDKFVIMVNTAKTDCFFYPELNCINPWHDYYINLSLSHTGTTTRYVKFMDMDLIKTIDIPLPNGVRIMKEFGAGVWSNINQDLVGVYLEAYNYMTVPAFFGMISPLGKENKRLAGTQNRHIFGLVVDRETLSPRKLNYYCYPKGERPDT